MTLSAVQADGASLRHHLQAVAQQTGEIPKELNELTAAPCPEILRHVWDMFLELHRARGNNGFGPDAICYTEMQAWAQLTAQHPAPFEIAAIKQIDALYLQHQAKATKAATTH